MEPGYNGRGQQQRHHQLQTAERQHQRFSWQTAPSTPPEETQIGQHPQQPQQQQPQQQQPLQQQRRSTQANNTDMRNRAFSYSRTPVEHRAFYYDPSNQPPLPQSPDTPIDPRPQSIFNPHSPTAQSPTQQQVHHSILAYSRESASIPIVLQQDGNVPTQFSPVSPIPAPEPTYTNPNHQNYPRHTRQRSNLMPLDTKVGRYNMPPVPASPLPAKTPITPDSPGLVKKLAPENPDTLSPSSRKSYAHAPYSPHGFTTPTHSVFSPQSAHGPNGLDFSKHQPGQIAHPNMDLSNHGTSHEWKHSLCECSGDISTCLTGLFCPCILYGRTSYRLSQRSQKKDPTDMLGHQSTNGHCMLMGAACGLWWLFPMVQRTRIRHLYKLTGSLFGDIAKGCCCCCCAAIQNEREVRDREETARRWAGPASTEAYTRQSQMMYAPQR